MRTECFIPGECLHKADKETSIRVLTKIIFSRYEELFVAPELGASLACKSVKFGQFSEYDGETDNIELDETKYKSQELLYAILEETAHMSHASVNPDIFNQIIDLKQAMSSLEINQSQRNQIYSERTRIMSMIEFTAMLAVMSFLNDSASTSAFARITGKSNQIAREHTHHMSARLLLKMRADDFKTGDDFGFELPYIQAYRYLWRYWEAKHGSELPQVARMSTTELQDHIKSVIGSKDASRINRDFETKLHQISDSGFWMTPYLD